MAVDYAGIATVIGSVATLVTAVGLTVRSFIPRREKDDDEGSDDLTATELIERLERITEKKARHENRRSSPPEHRRDGDEKGARLAWLPRRKAIA